MGVGIAMCASAAVAYCAVKCKDHFGRYHIQKEEERNDTENNPMSGVYHITTSDFNPSVNISANNGKLEDKPPDYDDWPNKVSRRGGTNSTGSGDSRDVIINVELHNSLDSYPNVPDINNTRQYDTPEIVVTFVDIPDQKTSASSSDCDEGICVDHTEQCTCAERASTMDSDTCAKQNTCGERVVSAGQITPDVKCITVANMDTTKHGDKVPLVNL